MSLEAYVGLSFVYTFVFREFSADDSSTITIFSFLFLYPSVLLYRFVYFFYTFERRVVFSLGDFYLAIFSRLYGEPSSVGLGKEGVRVLSLDFELRKKKMEGNNCDSEWLR